LNADSLSSSWSGISLVSRQVFTYVAYAKLHGRGLGLTCSHEHHVFNVRVIPDALKEFRCGLCRPNLANQEPDTYEITPALARWQRVSGKMDILTLTRIPGLLQHRTAFLDGVNERLVRLLRRHTISHDRDEMGLRQGLLA
jgi:hypothetical protein